ncbi:MAG: hypothetical protein ACTSP1_16280, partial [Candidatus Freyarchaeota archaeon]
MEKHEGRITPFYLPRYAPARYSSKKFLDPLSSAYHLWKYENFSLIFHIFVQNHLQAGSERRVKKIYKNSKTEKKTKKLFYYILKHNPLPKYEERL